MLKTTKTLIATAIIYTAGALAPAPAAQAYPHVGQRLTIHAAEQATKRQERKWHHGGADDRHDTGGFHVLKCQRGGQLVVFCKVYAPGLFSGCTYWDRVRVYGQRGHRYAEADPTIWTQLRCAGDKPDADPDAHFAPEPDGDTSPPDPRP